MPYTECKLPLYPCTFDMWDALSRETRPIVIYGMGNGADKLIKRFDGLGIKFSDIFASDGFVRGHSFHGIRVKTLSEIKELYGEFVIVLSFASNREDVIEQLEKINEQYDMYVPDMPVSGEEYFDKEFFNKNYESISRVYDLLSDIDSKNAFASVINYKLSGKMNFLASSYSIREEIYSLLSSFSEITSIVDAGAYNGDTFREAQRFFPKLTSAILVEADKKNFKKLEKNANEALNIKVKLFNSALWSECKTGVFIGSGNRNSSVSSSSSYQYKNEEVALVTLDSLCDEKVDYVKYDVEGAEMEALLGSSKTILKNKPVLLVSAYHRSCDVFSLALYLSEKYPFYNLYLRRLRCVPAWEIDLIAIPK